jgi:ribosomal protein S27AE
MEESRYHALAACSRFEAELEAYLEGEARPFVTSHAHDCVSCGALLADLQSIRVAARELPQEEPAHLVWTKVRATLEAEGALRLPACVQFDDELEGYLEGETRPFVTTHAHDCPACGAVLADLQSISAAARDLPEEEPSPLVWAKVRTSLAAEGALRPAACVQFDAELEAFLEGEPHPFIISHSHDCPSCGALLADLETLRMAALSLPEEEPSRAVWANVHATLEAEGAFGAPVSGWRQILQWRLFPHAIPLGVLAALLFLGSVLTMPTGDVQRWGSANEAASSQGVTQLASAIPVGEDGALARVVSDLERSFRANEASMAPDLKATYEKSLVSLDGSIEECLDSLRHEPGNTLAHDYLLTAYTRKAEVLSSALEFQGR